MYDEILITETIQPLYMITVKYKPSLTRYVIGTMAKSKVLWAMTKEIKINNGNIEHVKCEKISTSVIEQTN